MIPIDLNTVDTLNPTSNELTEFLDLLLLNGFTAGAYSTTATPSYIDKTWFAASWLAIPDRDDFLDYLEALGIEPINGNSYRYAHGVTKPDGTKLIGVYQIGVGVDWEGITLGIRFLGFGTPTALLNQGKRLNDDKDAS
jgi:hypothetical protein